MLSKEFQSALKSIREKLTKYEIAWALIGSANCSLQGVGIIPRDLDVIVKLDDLQKMDKIFDDYNVSATAELPSMAKTGEPAWEVKLTIDTVPVHILGEKNSGVYVSKLLSKCFTEVKLDEMSIPCLTLYAEADAYDETNRSEKAERVRTFIQTQV